MKDSTITSDRMDKIANIAIKCNDIATKLNKLLQTYDESDSLKYSPAMCLHLTHLLSLSNFLEVMAEDEEKAQKEKPVAILS